MIKIDMNNKDVVIDGDVGTVISEMAFAMSAICVAGVVEGNDGYKQDQAEAAVYAMLKGTEGWLKDIYDKDIDLERIGKELIKNAE